MPGTNHPQPTRQPPTQRNNPRTNQAPFTQEEERNTQGGTNTNGQPRYGSQDGQQSFERNQKNSAAQGERDEAEEGVDLLGGQRSPQANVRGRDQENIRSDERPESVSDEAEEAEEEEGVTR